MKKEENKIVEIILCIAGFFMAALLTAVILLSNSHTQNIPSIWVFILKLLPFFFTLSGIALFPAEKIKTPWNILLVILGFGMVLCYFFPKQAYYVLKSEWENFYLTSQVMMPFIILVIAFTMKMFGLKKKETVVFGITCLTFMLSGIEDLFFCLINPNLGTNTFIIPDKWDWAHHMTIRAGRILNKYEAFVFIGIHFLIIVLILYFSYSKAGLYLKTRIKKMIGSKI